MPTKRSMCFAIATLAAACVLQVADGGSPLMCHQFQIADAKCLPWGKDQFAKSGAYDVSRVVDDTLELLTAELPVLARMETLRRASIYIDRDTSKADRLLGALLTRTLDAEVTMEPKALALRYFDAGYLAATFGEAGVRTSFGPAANGNKLHEAAPGYPWLVRAYKLADEDRDMALALALVTVGARTSEHTMFVERAVKAVAVDDKERSDLLGWIAQIGGTSLENLRAKYPPAHASSQH